MKKVAHYRRAIWVKKTTSTLGKMLLDGFSKVPDGDAPVFSHASELDCVIARRSTIAQPLFLQFVLYEKGAPAPIISAATDAANIATNKAKAPQGSEFILSQLFCVVRGDDVVWTSHNNPIRESAAALLFSELLAKLGMGKGDFVFQAKLDTDEFKKAFDDGIKELDLGVGDFLPTLEMLMSDGSIPGSGMFGSLISKRPSADEIAAASDIRGKLVLRPGHSWKKPQVKKLLSTMASNVMDSHEDEFVIETKSGVRLTKKKMSVHKEYDVVGDKQILNAQDCNSKLNAVLVDLMDSGLLE